MDNIIIAFLTLAPIKLGIFAFLDYLGIVIKNKPFRIIINALKIIINIIYIAIFLYIFEQLKDGKIFSYDRTTRTGISIISFLLILIIIILSFFVVKNEKKHIVNLGLTEETMNQIELAIYFIFMAYLLYKLYSSAKKINKGIYTKEIEKNDIYKWVVLAIIVIIICVIKLYLMANETD